MVSPQQRINSGFLSAYFNIDLMSSRLLERATFLNTRPLLDMLQVYPLVLGQKHIDILDY